MSVCTCLCLYLSVYVYVGVYMSVCICLCVYVCVYMHHLSEQATQHASTCAHSCQLIQAFTSGTVIPAFQILSPAFVTLLPVDSSCKQVVTKLSSASQQHHTASTLSGQTALQVPVQVVYMSLRFAASSTCDCQLNM